MMLSLETIRNKKIVCVERFPFAELLSESIVIRVMHGQTEREFELSADHLRSLADYIDTANRNPNIISL